MDQNVAVITGASRGIGLAMAKALVEAGWAVCGLSRRRGEAAGVDWRSCDVTDRAAVNRLVEELAGEYADFRGLGMNSFCIE